MVITINKYQQFIINFILNKPKKLHLLSTRFQSEFKIELCRQKYMLWGKKMTVDREFHVFGEAICPK